MTTESNEFNVEVIDNKGADLYAELEPELKRLHEENITLLMATTTFSLLTLLTIHNMLKIVLFLTS